MSGVVKALHRHGYSANTAMPTRLPQGPPYPAGVARDRSNIGEMGICRSDGSPRSGCAWVPLRHPREDGQSRRGVGNE
eukprot:2170996-Rhodomonas_salina.2